MSAKKVSVAKIENNCEEVASLLRALSHPNRLLILGHLIQGEKTVSELQSLCDISQSQLSQFLNRMKLEGLITCKKDGRFCYYSATNQRVIKLIRAIHSIYC